MNIVEKYGGTSVGTIEQITAIAQHVKEMKEEGHQLVVVASAMGKTTNQLIAMANQISDRVNKRELDSLLSTGEQRTVTLLAMAIDALGIPAISLTGYQCGFITSHHHAHARIKDINFDLSMAGVKCGFSEGVFVLDGQTGMITATQVEADDRDTIQTIKTDRDALKDAITQALAGADALVTLYNLAPLGEYEVNFNFGDVTYNYEEDKASWRAYVMQGWVPKWMYFVKFEGMSEEEAKAMTAEADAAQIEKAQLFGAE